MILDKISYLSAIEETLNDDIKFSNLDIPAGKEINYITNLEKRITSDLKRLKDKEIIDKATHKNIKPVGSGPGNLYGSGNVHKETNNGFSPFRPILSAIGISALTGKRVKWDNDCAIKEHHLFCNHSSGFDDFSILTSNDYIKVTLMESLLFNRDHPSLNKNRRSLPLELFDDCKT